jgi:hypothetical protein
MALGLGLVAQIMFGPSPVSSLVHMIASKHYIEHFGLSQAIPFFVKIKLFIVALILCLWHSRAPEANPTDLIFSGIFVAAPLQKCRIWACISRTFDKNLPSKIGVRRMHGILCPFDDWARDADVACIVCCETPSRDRQCLRLLSCKLLHMRECANVLLVYRRILITWEEPTP